MQSSDIPAKFNIPFANAGTKNAIPEPSQIGTTPGAASLTDGFPPLTFTDINSGGVAPDGADFNGILYEITQASRWLMAGGLYQYDSAFSTAIGGYPIGAVLAKADNTGLWMSIAENNTTDPDTGGANWITIASSSFQAQVPGTIMTFAGTTAPTGYLACPTSQTNISRTTYANLFAAIGTTWGVGDGSTTFGMPWFAADTALLQAAATWATAINGNVISHSHAIFPDLQGTSVGAGNYVQPASNYAGAGTAYTKATGGSQNIAAGTRVMICVKY